MWQSGIDQIYNLNKRQEDQREKELRNSLDKYIKNLYNKSQCAYKMKICRKLQSGLKGCAIV